MGLMTSPSGGSVQPNSKIHKIMTNQTGLCLVSGLLLLVGGLGFLMVMAHHQFSHKTYFSENALLPGLVINAFDQELSAHRYLDALREEAGSNSDHSMGLVESFLTDMGLEVYTHNFTLNFPFGKGKQFHGQNLYAILRALRASSTEALVLSAPFRRQLSPDPPTEVSLALLLASAKFFRSQNYWAKDIIFLVTDHEMLGMQAWLEAYHDASGASSSIVDHGQLEARAGAIQAAINLEFSEERATHINVKIQGLNGQLPNLDLFNLINRLCMKEGMGNLFQHRHDIPYRGSSFLGTWKVYENNMRTLLSMMADQASGMANGNHGLFHRMGIEAVTLEGVNLNSKLAAKAGKKKKKKYPEVDLYQMGRIVEGTFRSLNNLLERFHQSFFYYVLPSSSRYVSIGMYMPGFGVVAAGLILPALGAWLKSQEESFNHSETGQTPKTSLPDVFSILPIFLWSHFLGFVALNLPLPASQIASEQLLLNIHYESVIFYSLTALCLLGALIPVVGGSARLNPSQRQVVKCLTLLELAAVSFTLSLSNFSLAYLTTAFVIGPLALLAYPDCLSHGRVKRWAVSLAMILGHPLVLAFLICLADAYRLDGRDMAPAKIIIRAFQNTKHALMYSVIDSFIYGNVTYSLCCLSYLPIWTLLWTTLHSKKSVDKLPAESQK